MLMLIIAVVAFILIHTSAMAATAKFCGVGIRAISYGVGPVLLRHRKIAIRALPLGGSVDLLGLNPDEEAADPRFDYRQKPTWAKLLIALSGCLCVFLAAVLIGARLALVSFAQTFPQLLLGAISPTGAAQLYLNGIPTLLRESPLQDVVAIVLAKVAALQLPPFPGCIGGQAVSILLSPLLDGRKLHPGVRALGWTLHATFAGSWLVAVGCFLLRIF